MDSNIGAVDASTAKHDPMCPASIHEEEDCWMCGHIARVREDEHRQMIDRQVASAITDKDTHGALSRHIYEKGYAAALRDAVEAVKAVPHVAVCGALCPCCMGDYDCDCGKREAFAAIEALGGKQ